MDTRCIRKLKSLPTEPCPLGRQAVDAARKGQDAGCPWFCNDRESNYCCWRYLADNGRPTEPAKVARLLMIDDSDVKKAIQTFKKRVTEDGEDAPV